MRLLFLVISSPCDVFTNDLRKTSRIYSCVLLFNRVNLLVHKKIFLLKVLLLLVALFKPPKLRWNQTQINIIYCNFWRCSEKNMCSLVWFNRRYLPESISKYLIRQPFFWNRYYLQTMRNRIWNHFYHLREIDPKVLVKIVAIVQNKNNFLIF